MGRGGELLYKNLLGGGGAEGRQFLKKICIKLDLICFKRGSILGEDASDQVRLTCSYNAIGNRSLHLNLQIAQGALLTREPWTACIHLDARQLHRFPVWLREYLFVTNCYAEHVLGGDQNLADLDSGPFSSGG